MNLVSPLKYFVALSLIAVTPASAQVLPPPASSEPAPRIRPRAKATPKPAPVTAQEETFQVLPAPALPAPSRTPNSTSDTGAEVVVDESAVIIVPPGVPSIPIPPRVVPKKLQAKPRVVKPKTYTLRVGGVDITKLNDAAAIQKLRAAHDAVLTTKVLLFDGVDDYAQSLRSLGVSLPYWKLLGFARAAATRRQNVDVPLRYEIDENRMTSALSTLAKQVNRSAKPTNLDVDNSGQVVLRGGDGVEVAISGSLQRLKSTLEASPVGPTPQRVELVVRRTPADRNGVTQTTLEQFKYLLASFSTPYDARIRGRTTNLRMAARLVNGTIVEAGEVFSANQAIGPRNAAAGWREAKMFVSGQVVNGIGSGICQCSTTIYNAALLAGLPIVERHPHMFRVDYAPASRDAAIYWGQKDMRFRNTTGGPIYVQTWLEGGRFHARLYGTRQPPPNVRVESRVVSRRGGTRSEAYRVRETSSGPVRERLSRDYYRPHP